MIRGGNGVESTPAGIAAGIPVAEPVSPPAEVLEVLKMSRNSSLSKNLPLTRLRARSRVRGGPVGLALGGGGARGIAHVGILEALEEYALLRPSILAGTSAGAVIAVLYAANTPVGDIREFSSELNWFSHVVKFSDILHMEEGALAGLLPNTRLGEIVEELIGRRTFDELPRDVAVTAADIQKRRRVLFTSRRVAKRINRRELERFLPPPRGDLPGVETLIVTDVSIGAAIRASCAVPGFFRPVQVGDMYLVDGGLVDQTPVDVVRAMGARFSIGVSLALSFMPEKLASPTRALSGTVGMLGISQLQRSLALADIGFQVSGIQTRSPVKAHQLDLIGIARLDMEQKLERTLGKEWLRRARAHTP
ncbi:MAG: hypothetical protein EA427_14935 [Spirochaetaceae bacterium]|nr:MAG: hypothetical protein EA427_14935 [Spirochaetaceae bacterium]